MGCIYKINNNINQKIYIGYTTQSVEKRMRQHKNDDIDHGTVLGRAIAKYGWKNFNYEIIEESDDKEHLLELEIYYIKHFNSKLPNGYNMTNGGEKLYGEFNPFYGKEHSEETRRLLSHYASQRVGDKNPFFGREHIDETKKVISKKNSLAVMAIDEEGKIIATFRSGKEAGQWCIDNNLSKSKTPNSCILKACKNGKRAFGYYWNYIEEGVETIETTSQDGRK